MTTAIGYFRRAVDLDPEYASAWASLSYCYLNQGANGWVPFAEGAERARETARRALEVEPELAAGHWALGSVHMYYDWDWKAAESCMRRALRLAPEDSLLAVSAATLLLNLGQVEEARRLVRRALALDPLNAGAHVAVRLAGEPCRASGRGRARVPEGARARSESHEDPFPPVRCPPAAGTRRRRIAGGRARGGRPFRLLGIALAQLALGHAAEADAALGN